MTMLRTDTGPIPPLSHEQAPRLFWQEGYGYREQVSRHAAPEGDEGWPREAPEMPQEALAGPAGYDGQGRCLHCGREPLTPMWRLWWVWLFAFLFVCMILGNLTGA
jgi:hypothetical protein